MAFKEYLHVERFGNTPVEGVELGEVYIFPKVDGTNASVWFRPENVDVLNAGSRTRQLDSVNPGNHDNQGFCQWAVKQSNLVSFLNRYPTYRLYGEWLVPHTFKGYRNEAWRKFYVFDVYNDETEQYLSYKDYAPILEEFGITYIPPLVIIKNGSYENFLKFVENNFFLCPDGGKPGEGIVLKNYDYQNKFGSQCFAKIIRQEFKDEHHRVMGAPEINTGLMNEERILGGIELSHLIDKTYAKIETDKGWSSKSIPELFNRVFYDVVKEELWDQLKEINFGTVNFKTLKALVIQRVKEHRKDLFS